MSYKDKYIARNNAYGNNIGDILKKSTVSKINDSFKDSPFSMSLSIDGVNTEVRLVTTDTYDEKTLLFRPDYIPNVGAIVDYSGLKWMIFDSFLNSIFPKSTLKLCSSSLKWLDENGSIKEAYFTYKVENTRSLGLDTGKIMLLPNEQRYILVQNNSDTVKIEKGKKFIFDGRCWKVTSIDRLIPAGLIYLELQEHDIDTAVDNVSLRIADYVGNVPNYTLKILNGDNLAIQAGHTLQLNVEVKNNGIINNSKSLTYVSSSPSIATVTSTGLVTTIANGHADILVSLSDDPTINDTLGMDVQLTVNPNVFVTIIGDDFIYCNTSKIYNEQVKNNGVIDNTRFVQWYLTSDDGVSAATLATLSSQSTTQCTITANSKGQKGYVRLKAVVIGSSTVIDVKRIQIRTLI